MWCTLSVVEVKGEVSAKREELKKKERINYKMNFTPILLIRA